MVCFLCLTNTSLSFFIVRLNVTGLGAFDPNEKNQQNLVVEKFNSRTIHCAQTCDEFYVFGESTIEYERYAGFTPIPMHPYSYFSEY